MTFGRKQEPGGEKRAAYKAGTRVFALAAICLVIWICIFPASHRRMLKGAGQSLPDTVEAISRARVATRILYVTAHPDDESEGILTTLARGLNADVALLSVTHGEGGQNAIGPEQGPELAILRTNELLAATKSYGVGLFFTRAPDFGYSKTADETLRIWNGRAVEDMVRVLRTYRPDIVINQWGGVHSGHGQHQATGILLPQAVEKAGDPSAFRDQVEEGLRPWRARQILEISRGSAAAGAWAVPINEISPLWGQTYAELGLEGFAHHRSQGITQFLDAPFFRQPIYLRPVNDETLDARSLDEPLESLSHLASSDKQTTVLDALDKADRELDSARTKALALQWGEAAKSIAEAGKAVEGLQAEYCQAGQAMEELCWRLARERSKIDAALADAAAVELFVRAEHSELVAGQTENVKVREQFRGDVGLKIRDTTLTAPQSWPVKAANDKDAKEGQSGETKSFAVEAPTNAAAPSSPEDAILPEPNPLISGRFEGELDGYAFAAEEPAMSIRETSTSSYLMPLSLIPAVTLTIDPTELMAPLSQLRAGNKPLNLLARIRYHGEGKAQITATLGAPPDWKVNPANATLIFSGPDDQLMRFYVTPPAHVAPGAYGLSPSASLGSKNYETSVETLPSLPSRIYSQPAKATVHVLDLKIPANLHIGYVAAENDPIPNELRQLGIRVDLLDDTQLAFGDLSHYDAIVVGIRAYELRAELVRANARVLDYVKSGGTVLVQYQRDYAWNGKNLAPYPATMPQITSRTTNENSPVRFLQPNSPVLNFPNRITLSDFQGWVQERGLYYWGDFDSRYEAVLGFTDPGESEVKGPLVWARDGKGVYIYTGISFFRQLPEGVSGAYRLFVNLISQSRNAQAMTRLPGSKKPG